MKLKHFIATVCFALCVISAKGESMTQQQALSIVKSYYGSRDVDYYLCSDYNGWRIFVDEDPLKGWEHDCAVYTFPGPNNWTGDPNPTIQLLRLPPDETLVPIEVKNRYGIRATEKPNIAYSNSPNPNTNVAERTYAVILSGGVNKNSNYERYWNDCSFIYQTLVKRYNIPYDNISVIMSDGTNPAVDMLTTDYRHISSPLDLDNNGTNDIQYAATLSNVQTVLSELSNELNEDDHLFIFVIDHGGTTDYDSESYICLWGNEKLYDYNLANLLTPLSNKYVNINVVLGQCYSGGFIDDLTKVGCVVATASAGNEPSWACSNIPYDEFVYYWTSAVNKANSYGIAIDSDADGDGFISMQEAFEYAQELDSNTETPQYISTPTSVGEDLAFDRLAWAIDLYIKDNAEDTGKEPNLTTDAFWKSPSVWVRNSADSIETHENPYYSADHQAATVYVKVHNRGKKDYDGKDNFWAHVYWAKASTGITVKTWKGLELYNNEVITGEHLRASKIPETVAGGYSLVPITWALPADMMGTVEDNGTEKHHFCLIGRIMDTYLDDAYDPTSYNYFDVKGDKKIAQKNVSIISKTELQQGTNIYVRNIYNTSHNYSLEIIPYQYLDYDIFDKAEVEISLSNPIYNAWERGGLQCNSITYTPSSDPLKVRFTSAQSKLENINLYGEEFEKICLKVDFHTSSLVDVSYSFDLIQRDEYGNIVGGETFIVESPVYNAWGPIIITPIEIGDGNILLETNLAGTESYTKWTDGNGSIIGNSGNITVYPTSQNNTFSITALNNEGEMSTGSITLESPIGIQSATPIVMVNDYIDIEFKNEIYSTETTIFVNSLDHTYSMPEVIVPVGVKSMRINTSSLPNGLYVLALVVNGQIVDSLKFEK